MYITRRSTGSLTLPVNSVLCEKPMRLSKLSLGLGLLLCVGTVFPSICQSRSLSIKDLQGSWTRKEFIDMVRSTRSPFATHPETVTIKDHKFFWTSYHEGSWRKIVRMAMDKAKGDYRLVLGPWEEEHPSASELIEVPITLALGSNGEIEKITFLTDSVVTNKQEPFVRMTVPLGKLVAQILLVGTYKDQNGQSYVFGKSGMAVWPGASFPYEVALDATEAFCDYILVDPAKNPVNAKTYGFKWVDSKLRLFYIKEKEWGVNCEDQPFAILTPQKQ